MAQADFGIMTSGLSQSDCKNGVTAGVAPPNGGGSFVYGFNSKNANVGAVALYSAQANFAPMAKGGSVRGAIQRGSASGGPTNFSPFLFLCASSDDVGSAECYMLGLDDDSPHAITLVKGQLQNGIPSVALGEMGVLARGTAKYPAGTWLHVRLDAVVNANGDVILLCFQNDLTANPVTAPVWTPVAGLATAGVYVDDVLGINSGSDPYTSGYIGFGFTTKDITRQAFFDQIEVERQL